MLAHGSPPTHAAATAGPASNSAVGRWFADGTKSCGWPASGTTRNESQPGGQRVSQRMGWLDARFPKTRSASSESRSMDARTAVRRASTSASVGTAAARGS